MTLPANIQGSALVQLGYGSIAPGAPMQWIYTPRDNGSGIVITKTGLSIGDPQINVRYSFLVWYSYPNGDWMYRITNLTTGLSSQWKGTSHVHTAGNETWYGYELYNFSDEFAGPDANYGLLFDMAYQQQYQNTTIYLTGTQTLHWIHSPLVYFHASSISGPHSFLEGFTDNH